MEHSLYSWTDFDDIFRLDPVYLELIPFGGGRSCRVCRSTARGPAWRSSTTSLDTSGVTFFIFTKWKPCIDMYEHDHGYQHRVRRRHPPNEQVRSRILYSGLMC